MMINQNLFDFDHKAKNNVLMINIYNPYKAMFPVSPKSVVSVGDQVLSEYVFAFQGKESITGGFQSLFSDITFDYENNTVTIKPKHPIITANGYKLSNQEIFEGILRTLNGTRHVPFKSSIIKTVIQEDKLKIHFFKIPVNLKYLFTLPDFSIQKSGSEILTTERNLDTTGPYYIDSVSDEKISLRVNPNYPVELTANKVSDVNLVYYPVDQTEKLINSANIDNYHFLYLYGHTLNENMINTLIQKKFKINIHPNEWLVYLKISDRIPLANRVYISKLMNDIRNNNKNYSPYGQKTYSFSPSDRPNGLSEKEYYEIITHQSENNHNLNAKFKIGTLSNWDVHIFNSIKKSILSKFKNAEFITYPRNEYLKMINETDVSIAMLGISPADPISHLSFLLETDPQFKKITTKEELNEISMISDFNEFIHRIKNIESKIVRSQLYIPIANFPGVVAVSPQFELDSDLAWSWGIQSWNYHRR